MGSEIAGDHFRHATVNPTSNGRPWDIQLGEEVSISGLANCLLDSVVVGPSRGEGFHCDRIGRCLRSGGAARKWPALSGRCSCNASDPECHGPQRGPPSNPRTSYPYTYDQLIARSKGPKLTTKPPRLSRRLWGVPGASRVPSLRSREISQQLVCIKEMLQKSGARDWSRTSTSLRTLDSESSASTNSATRAARRRVR
jgi:hypothetical protein